MVFLCSVLFKATKCTLGNTVTEKLIELVYVLEDLLAHCFEKNLFSADELASVEK